MCMTARLRQHVGLGRRLTKPVHVHLVMQVAQEKFDSKALGSRMNVGWR